MKITMIILSIALNIFLLLGQAMAEEHGTTKTATMSKKEKASYSLGYETGRNMKDNAVDLDPEIYIKAFREGFAGDKAAMTDQEMIDALGTLKSETKAKEEAKKNKSPEGNKQLAERNKKEGEAFLAENTLQQGVVTLPSGLQYKIIKEGTGKQPGMTDKVKVHYRGTLIDGTEFGSSYKQGEPVTFSVNGMIKGLSEGLLLMREGSKWMLYVPTALGYGARGARRGKIGPNQALIFEVELISIQPQEPKNESKNGK